MSSDAIRRVRPAAYAVCVEDERILLARWIGADGTRLWTMPGGGLDHGEDPYDAAIREVAEETGYEVELVRLLGVDSENFLIPADSVTPQPRDLHGLRIVYEGRVTGGELRNETDGSTDLAAWIPLAEVSELKRVSLVDIAIALYRDRPALGRIVR
ncbi:NUDIX hydrolase [Kitasatospora kifunensis]|uniref:ADP-ribose pyrophosphatase YjhB (NUDIX family) n=1 Tax=Kitasatospora kifunensis TaxID=58351 RepID=A0A7W7VVS6_KITKI|nr:NUDIX hydrolase [Kitasatospora kifunensis]MBB4924208.1 ADP-ribose pyrophosphatase YjhB (NUDIX family) [Kitasatospora kifunensis]